MGKGEGGGQEEGGVNTSFCYLTVPNPCEFNFVNHSTY